VQNSIVKRRSLLQSIAVLPALQAAPPYRAWLGPDYWANPLQDWRSNANRWECHAAGGDRNVFWLSKEIAPTPTSFEMSVRLGTLAPLPANAKGWTGFRTGMRGAFDDYRDTAIRGLGVDSGITADGQLFIGSPNLNNPRVNSLEDLTLTLTAQGNRYTLKAGNQTVEATIPNEWLSGGVALVCHSGDTPTRMPRRTEPMAANTGKPNQARGGDMCMWFSDWKLTGPFVVNKPERAWGPILFTQYTVHAGVLKMTVQLAPLEGDESPATLELGNTKQLRGQLDTYSSTASFRVENLKCSAPDVVDSALGVNYCH